METKDYEASILQPKKVTITNTTNNEFDLQMYRVNLQLLIGGRSSKYPDGQEVDFIIESSEEYVYYASVIENLGDEWNIDNNHKISIAFEDAGGGSSSSGNMDFNWDKFFEEVVQDTVVDNIFKYQDNMRYVSSITIPDTATAIGEYAFSNWDSLSEVKIPNTITSIGDDAFAECPSLVSITIPGSVESLGSSVFACDGGNKAALESITFETPSSLTSIGNNAFESQWHLPSLIIPDSVETIGENCFINCEALKSVSLPNQLTELGDYVFDSCGLESITLPNTLTTIGANCFSNTDLTQITIPSSVETIGENCFSNCAALETITINKAEGSITGAPWGAPETTQIIWNG